jgi:hypothetical protein
VIIYAKKKDIYVSQYVGAVADALVTGADGTNCKISTGDCDIFFMSGTF